MDKVDELFNKGVEKWQAAVKGRPDYELNLSMAESFVRKSLEQRKNAYTLSTYARILIDLGELKEAAKYAEEAIRLDSNSVYSWLAQYEVSAHEFIKINKGDSFFKGLRNMNAEDKLNKAAKGVAEAYKFSTQKPLPPEELLNLTDKVILVAELQRKIQLQSRMLYTNVLEVLQKIPFTELSDKLQEHYAVADSVLRTQKLLR